MKTLQKYLEYLYLIAAILLWVIYQQYRSEMGPWGGYGMIGGMILFAFLFSLRRTLRRIQERNDPKSNNNQ